MRGGAAKKRVMYTPDAFAALKRSRINGNENAVEGKAIDAIALAPRAEIAEMEQDQDFCPDDRSLLNRCA